jgi:hypothetical protein
MFTRFRSAWRRSNRGGRLTRLAVRAGIPVAVIVIVGASLAVFDGKNLDSLSQAALGSCVSPGASASATPDVGGSPAADPGGSSAPDPSGSPAPDPGGSPAAGTSGSSAPVPCPSSTASPSGPRVAVTDATFANGPIAAQQLGDVAWAPVDGQGNVISPDQTAAQATASMNCTLIVPAHPLTAGGLATPYQLGDGCSEANPNLQAFVEATILPPNGHVRVYNPLVITQGSTPGAMPVVPQIPRGSQVILDFGFNGTNLVLAGPGAWERSSGCVDALGQSVIGQVSACNAVGFYRLANAEIARGILRVPALGTGTDGQACLTTRDFALIDQDQSDNVVTQYLIGADGQTAQATAANKANFPSATLITNGSDDALLSHFVDPANGCTSLTAPDATNPNGSAASQALNELSARVNQQNNIAVVPPNDEMTLVNTDYSVDKTNVYRSLVDQPLLAQNTNLTMVAASYCQHMVNIAPARDNLDMTADAAFGTPVAAMGDNLATFLGNRLSQSFTNLGCASFGLTNPVNVTLDGNGVATAVSYNTAQQQATIPESVMSAGGQGVVSAGGQGKAPGQGRGHHHKMQNPSHM